MAHEILQQPELAGLQGHHLTLPPHLLTQQVHFQVGDLEARGHLGAGLAAATAQYFQPRQQLSHGKGLDQVVIRTAMEPLNPVIDIPQCAQDQHRRIDSIPPHAGQKRQSIQAG